MDVENIDALNPAELDALLERALNPQVPVEVFYAVLERIGPYEPAPETVSAQACGETAGQSRTVRPGQSAQSTHSTQSVSASGAAQSSPLPVQQSSTSPVSPTPILLQGHQNPSPLASAHESQTPHVVQGSIAAHQQAMQQVSPQAQAGRRAAQHNPTPRGFAAPSPDTEATTVMRAITDADGPRAIAAAPSDASVAATAQTTTMPAVPVSEADDRGEGRTAP